jgi:MarR family transcriptional regulator, transcriptional regulator for hemolysin
MIYFGKPLYNSTLIKKANRLLINKANALLNDYGLTDAYCYFLMALYQKDGVTQSVLHKEIGIEQPTAVRTLGRMERDGLIKKVPCPDDKRAIQIWLTDKGWSYQNAIEDCAEQLNAWAFSHFAPQEASMLNQLLEKMLRHIDGT